MSRWELVLAVATFALAFIGVALTVLLVVDAYFVR